MHVFHVGDRRYAQFHGLRHAAGLVHAFCTRPADVSPRADGDAEIRAARRRQMARDLGLDPDRLVYCQQVHQTRIAVIGDLTMCGPLDACDGVATALPGVPLMTFSADCPLVLVHDPGRRVLGLAHASWRCTVAVLTRRLVEVMHAQFGCQPADLEAGIGPGAGPCCYEVQRDVYEAAADLPQREGVFVRRDGRLYFDLWRANHEQLTAAGIRPQNIEVAGVCTMCGDDAFYSFRREGAGCGHFGLLAALVAR